MERVASSDSEDEQSPGGDEEWEEWDGDEEEDDTTRSLFDGSALPSPEAALAHDAATHGFDLRRFRAEARLDDYDTIKLINFIRAEVTAGRDPRPALAASSSQAGAPQQQAPWADERYLQPVLPDDALLGYDFDDDAPQGGGEPRQAAAGDASGSLAAQLAALAAENEELQLRCAALMEAALPAELRQQLREAAATDGGAAAGPSSRAAGEAARSSAGAGPSAAAAAAGPSTGFVRPVPGGGSLAGIAQRRGVDAAYFDSYAAFDIHHDMLADKPRTLAYQRALTANPSLMRGASVLDVGCGTGILSLFAARGGAASVVGLDGSERIAGFARQVVAANKLDAASGGPVRIVSGKVEDAPDIGTPQVSVIVSEWMGYALLFESMLDSLLVARDKWLAPGGAVLPDRASIHVAGAHAGVFGTAFWQDVYGFSMAPIAHELAAAAARESKVLVRPVEPACLVTPAVQVHALDLATMAPHEQDFTASFELHAAGGSNDGNSSSSSSDNSTVAALVLWFDVAFSERFCKDAPAVLSTGPAAEATHWSQAVLPLARPVELQPGSSLSCRLSMARSRSRHRALDISLEVGCAGEPAARQARAYTMRVEEDEASAAAS